MANCHDAFLEYLQELNLTDTQFKKLTTSRDALITTISGNFKEKGRKVPEYNSQGSYALDTINRPISEDYDLDHGVYLTHLADTDRITALEALELIREAVKGQTTVPLPHKDTCVRVQYKAAQDTPAHHIDLAIYRQFASGTKKYAHEKKGWLDTDQKGFIDLFKKKVAATPQLRPIVRVFKGWSDFNREAVKFPSGFHFTVCAMDVFAHVPDRHDQALVVTADRILQRLRAYAARTGAPFNRPVTPFEDLFQDYDFNRLAGIIKQFEHLVEQGKRALAEPDLGKAQRIWRELLGERFPAPPAGKVDDPGRVFGAPAILGAADKAG